MNAVDLGMYYDERKLKALREHYDGTIEGYVEYQLNTLFEEVVPNDVQNAIEELNLQEELQAEREAQENIRFSLNHIRQNDVDYYFTDRDAQSFFAAANIYRVYSRRNIAKSPLPKSTLVQEHHLFRIDIDKGEYDELLNQYGLNKHVVSVLDFDLDDGTARVMLDGESEWYSYMLKDISTAVFYANKNKYGNFDFKEMKFNEHLEGKEIDNPDEDINCDEDNNPAMQM